MQDTYGSNGTSAAHLFFPSMSKRREVRVEIPEISVIRLSYRSRKTRRRRWDRLSMWEIRLCWKLSSRSFSSPSNMGHSSKPRLAGRDTHRHPSMQINSLPFRLTSQFSIYLHHLNHYLFVCNSLSWMQKPCKTSCVVNAENSSGAVS